MTAPAMTARPIDRCRVCGNASLVPCLSLGDQYLSSIFPERLDYHDRLPRLPLDLVLCDPASSSSACGLPQLAHHFDMRAMYEAYPYTSATNAAMLAVLEDVARGGRAARPLADGDVVLDIGCNDGSLLGYFAGDPIDLVGIDPAQNVRFLLPEGRARHARDYFSADVYRRLGARPASLAFSVAMFYHLADPVGLARDVASCLAEDGVWVVQMAYLPAMMTTNMYDNIVHEHVGYYATCHMQAVMARAGLEIFDVELNDVYGGSFRVFVKHAGCARYPMTDRCRRTLDDERTAGLHDVSTYMAFADRVARTRDDLRALCARLRAAGQSIWIYGASTKGNTILQYCGLGAADFVAAADSSPFKIGKYLIGSDVPIRSEAEMRAAHPGFLLALPYSFVSAFIERERVLVDAGTRFIVPLPEVTTVP